MKKTSIALLLVAGPLAAQNYEVGLFIGQQSYRSNSTSGGAGTITYSGTTEPAKKTVAGIRFGYSIVDLGPALLQVTAGYQPEVKTDLEYHGTSSVFPGGSISGTAGQFGQKHWSVGAIFNFKAFVAVGAGLEYRSESLSATSDGDSASTTYGRPWARVNAGIAFPTPLVKPFVGLEVCAPLTSTSYKSGDSASTALKSYAPKLQVGLYGGIRF